MRYLHVAGNCYWRVWGFYKMKRTLLLAASAAVLAAPTIAQELPPGNPLPGECFARVIVPATYETSTEQVVLRQAGEEIVKIPGRFETVTERVLVQEASTELVIAGSGAGGGTFRANGKSYSVSGDGSVYSYGSGSGAGAGGAGGTLVGRIENGNFVGTNGSIIARNVSVNYATSGSRSGHLHSAQSLKQLLFKKRLQSLSLSRLFTTQSRRLLLFSQSQLNTLLFLLCTKTTQTQLLFRKPLLSS